MSIEEQEKTEPNVPNVEAAPNDPAAPETPAEPAFAQGHEVHPDNHEPYDDPVAAK
jgi:hypothetical protein